MKFTKFTSGVAPPRVFRHRGRKPWLTVRGDDFAQLASGEDLDWFEKKIPEEFEAQARGRLGPTSED